MIEYFYVRLVHGVLMTLAFVGFHFLGAVIGRRLADENTKVTPRQRYAKILFWLHGVLQAIGLILGTAGFVISMKRFRIPYDLVMYEHGTLGIAVMSLAYFQGAMGVARPRALTNEEIAAKAPRVYLRRGFEYLHAALGKVTLVLGLINVYTGVALFKSYLKDEGIEKWAGVTIGWMVLVVLCDSFADKYQRDGERFAKVVESTSAEEFVGGERESHGGEVAKVDHKANPLNQP